MALVRRQGGDAIHSLRGRRDLESVGAHRYLSPGNVEPAVNGVPRHCPGVRRHRVTQSNRVAVVFQLSLYMLLHVSTDVNAAVVQLLVVD